VTGQLLIIGLVLVLAAAGVGFVVDSGNGGTARDAVPTPAPASTGPGPTLQPAQPEPANRLNCDAIRGTTYLSEEERAWFINNCTTS
jgi:hypothetical protein